MHAVETMQCIILMANTLLESNQEQVLPEIIELGEKTVDVLVRLVSQQGCDWFVRDEGCKLLGTILAAAPRLLSAETRNTLMNWLIEQLKLPIDKQPADVRTALKCAMKLLFQKSLRTEFTHGKHFALFVTIAATCMAPNKFQAVYESLYCVWLLTFERHVQRHPGKDVVAAAVNALRTLQKEKIVRVSLGILKNLSAEKENMNKMIECQLLTLLPQLQARKTADPEITADLEALSEALNAQASEMSTWETYRHAVLGKTLDWSPVHKSENFWKENPFRFEENNDEVLIALRDILTDSTDPVTLSVACYDIGEFVLAHPKGKSIVTKLGIKNVLMKHMMAADPDLKRNAVLAYQKIVLNGWEAAASL